MATLTTARRSTERGQAVIELALTLPLLLVVVFGIIDFGFMFQRYEAVTNAAREGARLGVLADYTATEAQNRALDYLRRQRAQRTHPRLRHWHRREELAVRSDDHVDRAGCRQHASQDRRSGHRDC